MTSKVKAKGRVHGQQKEHNQNNADLDKTGEGTGDGRSTNNKEGENTNMGKEQVTATKDGPGPLWELQGTIRKQFYWPTQT